MELLRLLCSFRSEDKIYESNELAWHEIVFRENPLEEFMQITQHCRDMLEKCRNKTLAAIEAIK